MIRKAYVRHREALPENPSLYAIEEGLRQLGVETAPFYGFGDVKEIQDLSEEVGVFGFVGDVFEGLDKIGAARPEPLDYPEELRGFLGRRVWRTSMRAVVLASREFGPEKTTYGERRVFVKPVRHKVFTGRVWTGDMADRMATVLAEENEPVWCSEFVEFVSEHRCFVLEDRILDVRRYKGDWSVGPDRATVERAVMAFGSSPAAYAADFGVTRDGRTLLVEVNDAFALGGYGLGPVFHARMAVIRWEQMAGRKDV